MDRISELAQELSETLEQLHREAAKRNQRELMAPLAWLDEANGWLSYELARAYGATPPEPVPFTYVPIHMRGSHN